jgi:hypothetical protein
MGRRRGKGQIGAIDRDIRHHIEISTTNVARASLVLPQTEYEIAVLVIPI